MASTLRMDSELDAALDALAESEGTSKQDVIRRAVLGRYERLGHQAMVRESAVRLTERWGDLLDRLGWA